MSVFGDRVRSYRLGAHLRQSDFSKHGITQSQLSLIEHGDVAPSAVKVKIIAEMLHLAPADLIAGTELQSVGDALSGPLHRDERAEYAEWQWRSKQLVALEESYLRIQQLFEVVAGAQGDGIATLDDEAYYQLALRINRRSVEALQQCDIAMSDHAYALPSLLGDRDIDLKSLHMMMRRSCAYIHSMILEYPEADTPSARSEIRTRIGLDRIDRYIERRAE